MKMTIYSWYKWLNEAVHIGKGKRPGNRPVIEAKTNEVRGFYFAVQRARHEKMSEPYAF
jgi:hypothetical protein